jgi:prepilin-type N-terminal cleavage/methylation domain-containing protein/prepilin-type processing-associated H-X9-DG protein
MATLSRQRAQGFTLIELLVVIAIIAILIGMLVPAVQKVRESADRTQCQNSLKQIGLALHSYENQYKCFPPSKLTGSAPNQGWTLLILPYIEQATLANQFDFTKNFDAKSNQPVITTQVSIFVCPSAPDPEARYQINPAASPTPTTLTNPAAQMGAIDYGSINEVFPDFYLLNNIPAPADPTGVLQKGVTTRIIAILDGTSNTIMVGEDAGAPTNWILGQLSETTSPTPDWGWADPGFAYSINGCDPATGAIIKQTATSGNPSCIINCNNNGEIYSFHNGGANCLFADGSVHFLSTAISLPTFAALFTARGGELLLDFEP